MSLELKLKSACKIKVTEPHTCEDNVPLHVRTKVPKHSTSLWSPSLKLPEEQWPL